MADALTACRVVATCRNPESCVELQHLQSKHPAALELIQLDVTSDASIAVRQVGALCYSIGQALNYPSSRLLQTK